MKGMVEDGSPLILRQETPVRTDDHGRTPGEESSVHVSVDPCKVYVTPPRVRQHGAVDVTPDGTCATTRPWSCARNTTTGPRPVRGGPSTPVGLVVED